MYLLMVIWKTDKLIDQLRSGSVPQLDQAKYLLVILGFSLICGSLPKESMGMTLETTYILISITSFVVGVFFCYRANKSAGDRDFCSRYIALCLPISVRLIVFTLLFGGIIFTLTMFSLGIYAEITGKEDGWWPFTSWPSHVTNSVQITVFTLYSVMCEWLLYRAFKKIGRTSGDFS